MLHDAIAGGSPSSKPRIPRWAGFAAAALLATGGIAVYRFQQYQSAQSRAAQELAASITEIKTVTALGRLEPKGEVIKLSAPTSSQENRVERLLVKEGDRIQKGQIIAILDSRDRLKPLCKKRRNRRRWRKQNWPSLKLEPSKDRLMPNAQRLPGWNPNTRGD